MRIPRLLTIVGPAAVLYLLAARASLQVGSSHEGAVAVLSLLLSLTPLFLLATPSARGSSRLAWMGVSLAVAVASLGTTSVPLIWTHAVGWLSAALVMVDLVLPRSLRPAIRAVPVGLLAIVSFGGAALVPITWPLGITCGAVVFASVVATAGLQLRVSFRRDRPWMGLLAASTLIGLGLALEYAWFGPPLGLARLSLEFTVAILFWVGHLAWIDPHRRALRRSGVPFLVASASTFGAGVLLSTRLPDTPWQLGLAAIGLGILWWISFRVADKLAVGTNWNPSGNLSDRLNASRRGVYGGSTLEEIARGTLTPLGAGLGTEGPTPELFTLQPPLRVRLSAGNRPNIRSGDAPAVMINAAFEAKDSGVLDLIVLRERVVREPVVRELVNRMESLEMGAVLPCSYLDHVEALLLLPVGNRADAFSRLEIEAFGRLGEALGRALCSALAHRRAESHIEELSVLHRDAEDRAMALEGELRQLRGKDNVPASAPGQAENQSSNPDPLAGTYLEVERRLLERALRLAHGNKSEAARILGLKRTTFLDKLRRHQLEGKPPGAVGGSAVG